MKMMMITLILCISATAWAGTKVAVVKLIRGEASVLTLGKTTPLKVEDWVEDGAVVKTEEKSFVKLVFIDKSQMNVGPSSEMKIESFSGKDSGVIDLVKGKIRSQVTKDYLQIQDKNKSKLFIKTQNAVMGVRGTDFLIATNGRNTSTILFEGEIVFNKLDADTRGETSSSRLEAIVDSGVRMFPGEFSVVDQERSQPTVPSLLNIQQREHLEKNQTFDSNRTPSNAQETSKSIVPEGLNGQQVSNSSETLKTEVSQVAAVESRAAVVPSSSDPDGYVKGDQVKPANGSFVHIDSGVIIPPGPDSVLDANTNSYIPGQGSGKVAQDGSYIAPKNVEITGEGKILVMGENNTVVEKTPAVPVKQETAIFKQEASPVTTTERGPSSGSALVVPKVNPDVTSPMAGGAMDNRFTQQQSGGFTGVADPTRVIDRTTTDTTIIVKPGN